MSVPELSAVTITKEWKQIAHGHNREVEFYMAWAGGGCETISIILDILRIWPLEEVGRLHPVVTYKLVT